MSPANRLSKYPGGWNGGTVTSGATLQRWSYFQSPAHRFSAIRTRSLNDRR